MGPQPLGEMHFLHRSFKSERVPLCRVSPASLTIDAKALSTPANAHFGASFQSVNSSTDQVVPTPRPLGLCFANVGPRIWRFHLFLVHHIQRRNPPVLHALNLLRLVYLPFDCCVAVFVRAEVVLVKQLLHYTFPLSDVHRYPRMRISLQLDDIRAHCSSYVLCVHPSSTHGADNAASGELTVASADPSFRDTTSFAT